MRLELVLIIQLLEQIPYIFEIYEVFDQGLFLLAKQSIMFLLYLEFGYQSVQSH